MRRTSARRRDRVFHITKAGNPRETDRIRNARKKSQEIELPSEPETAPRGGFPLPNCGTCHATFEVFYLPHTHSFSPVSHLMVLPCGASMRVWDWGVGPGSVCSVPTDWVGPPRVRQPAGQHSWTEGQEVVETSPSQSNPSADERGRAGTRKTTPRTGMT